MCGSLFYHRNSRWSLMNELHPNPGFMRIGGSRHAVGHSSIVIRRWCCINGTPCAMIAAIVRPCSLSLLIFLMSLFHIYVCCCFVGGGGGSWSFVLHVQRDRKSKCVLRTRCVCEDLCFVFSDWAIAEWVLWCAAIDRQNTGLRYTHISRTRSWHFSYFSLHAFIAQPLLLSPCC